MARTGAREARERAVGVALGDQLQSLLELRPGPAASHRIQQRLREYGPGKHVTIQRQTLRLGPCDDIRKAHHAPSAWQGHTAEVAKPDREHGKGIACRLVAEPPKCLIEALQIARADEQEDAHPEIAEGERAKRPEERVAGGPLNAPTPVEIGGDEVDNRRGTHSVDGEVMLRRERAAETVAHGPQSGTRGDDGSRMAFRTVHARHVGHMTVRNQNPQCDKRLQLFGGRKG
jgi:hypothetical protein